MRSGCGALVVAVLVALALWRWDACRRGACDILPGARDRIEAPGNVAAAGLAGPETAIVVDADLGPLGGCRNDQLAPTPAKFGNLRLSTCSTRDEILVLSVDDPFIIDTSDPGSGGIWTDAAGEVRTVAADAAMPTVPLVLYVLADVGAVSCKVSGPLASLGGLGCDVRNLEYAYNLQRAGLAFDAQLVDRRGDRAALAAIGCRADGTECVCPAAAPSDPTLYSPAVINIYVVGAIHGGGNARNCETMKRDFIYLSVLRGPFTLAHELGHSFALPHPDGSWTYTTSAAESFADGKNLMMSGQGEEGFIRLGQAVRMNLLPFSWVNSGGHRPGGVVRTCESDWTVDWGAHAAGASEDGACPRLAFP